MFVHIRTTKERESERKRDVRIYTGCFKKDELAMCSYILFIKLNKKFSVTTVTKTLSQKVNFDSRLKEFISIF